jgi:hypothetical protein
VEFGRFLDIMSSELMVGFHDWPWSEDMSILAENLSLSWYKETPDGTLEWVERAPKLDKIQEFD